MQFNSSLNKQEYISIETSNIRTKGANALAVRDSNVSKWCLRARKGIGKYERENFLLLRPISTKVSHLVSFEVLSGLVPRPLARYKSNDPLPFDILSTHAMDEREQES